jgi:CelD/BcsL family acetyltransferase involved in cellulose biosynthesis
MSYDVKVIRDRSEIHELLPEWREFLTGNVRGREFLNDPEMVEFAVAQEPSISPHIVLVRQNGALHCVAPFVIQKSRYPLQLSVFELTSFATRVLSLVGSNLVYANDANPMECCSLVFGALPGAEFDLGLLRDVSVGSPLWAYCARTSNGTSRMSFRRPERITDMAFRLELGGSFQEYLSQLGRKTRETLKRRTKRLQADHSAKLVKITSAEEISAFLDNVNTVFGDSWQARTFGAVQRNTAAEKCRLEYIAGRGWLRSYLLTSDLGPLAFQYGYRYGDAYYACDFAYSLQCSELGPGAVLMYLMLEDLYREERPRVVDLGVGKSPQKWTFRATPHEVGNYLLLRRNRWRHVASVQRVLSEIEGLVRTVLTRIRLDRPVRRFLKHKTSK